MLQTKSPWLLNLETTFLDLGGYSATMTNNRALLFFFFNKRYLSRALTMLVVSFCLLFLYVSKKLLYKDSLSKVTYFKHSFNQ